MRLFLSSIRPPAGPLQPLGSALASLARHTAAGLLLMAPALVPSLAAAAVPASVTIAGSPLQIRVGEDNSFQVSSSEVPGRGLIQPYTVVDGTADMGFIVAWPGALYKPDFSQHLGSHITEFSLTGTPYTPRSLSAVSGSGTAADPFTVTVTSALGDSGVTATMTVQYVNGSRQFSKALTLDNAAGIGTTRAAQIMLGAALASPTGDGKTQPFFEEATRSPGGQGASTAGSASGCPVAGATPHRMWLTPSDAPDGYFAGYFNAIWRQIDRASLENRVDSNCDENGGALQWSRPLAPGAQVTVAASMTVGELAAPRQYTLGGTVAGLAGSGLVLGESQSGQTLAVSANGPLRFAAPVADAAAYAVTVLTQPTSPAQTCSVAQGSGTVSGADVGNIAVSCLSVGQVPTLLSLAAAPNPIVLGQPLTLRATVAAKPEDAPAPDSQAKASTKAAATGTVSFVDNGTPIGSAPLGADGVATLTVSNLAAGNHALTASYAGDAANGPSSTLTPLSVLVQAGPVQPAAVAVPTLSAWALALLAVVLGLLGLVRRRRM
ncbi:MAG: Ig-like domain-containing protein [Comamonas sp.]|nr:Ig-like domain-containing protein [Comamonas sp.]